MTFLCSEYKRRGEMISDETWVRFSGITAIDTLQVPSDRVNSLLMA